MCWWFKRTDTSSALYKAKHMKKTKNNNIITTGVWKRFSTKPHMKELAKRELNYKILFSDRLSQMTQIIPNLYLTGVGGLSQENIKENGIKAVVNVTWEVSIPVIPGINAIRIPVDDDPKEDLSVYFDEVCDQIDKWISHQKPVVIHCLCGVSRSVTITLAYLMKYKGLPLRTAFFKVRKNRPIIKPNYSFIEQLIEYEKKIFKKTTVKMVPFKTRTGKMVLTPDLYIELFAEESRKEEESEGGADTIFSATATTSFESIFQ